MEAILSSFLRKLKALNFRDNHWKATVKTDKYSFVSDLGPRSAIGRAPDS